MFHLAAFSEDPAAAVDDAPISPLADDVLTIRDDGYFFSDRRDLLFAAAMGATLDDARLNSPSLRLPTFPYLNVNESVTPPSPLNLTDYRLNPFRLSPGERLQAEATDPAVAPGFITVIVGLSRQVAAKPTGQIVRLQGVSTSIATANVWTTLPTVTWTNNLPDGLYAVVGMEHFSTNGQAARLIFISPTGQIDRPGCISITARGNITHPVFRMGNLGKWGEFTADNIPNVEVLCNGADAAHTIYLDLIRLG